MTLGVAVVGAGDMGRRHAQHWQQAGAHLVAICDAYKPLAERVAATHNAKAFVSLEDALKNVGADIQVVSVCTPTFLHAPISLTALSNGKHVLCEKPVALTLEDAKAMKQAAQTNHKELRIGFMRRFDPAYPQLVSACERVGSPLLAHATIAAGIRPKRLMHDANANGGPIIDMCCHVFNLWEGIFGCHPETVSAHGYTFSEDKLELTGITHKAVDSAHISLHYPNGCHGHIQVSWGLPTGVEAVETHAYIGPSGMVRANWNEEITLNDGQGTTTWTRDSSDANLLDPWRREIAQFYLELTQDAPRQVAAIEDGMNALDISLAVLTSIQTQ
ncbi:MAG: Gfo/Idh/MocA family oxidoreductase, partial [Deinococcota bacterium]